MLALDQLEVVPIFKNVLDFAVAVVLVSRSSVSIGQEDRGNAVVSRQKGIIYEAELGREVWSK
jgi:hypothetical protein